MPEDRVEVVCQVKSWDDGDALIWSRNASNLSNPDLVRISVMFDLFSGAYKAFVVSSYTISLHVFDFNPHGYGDISIRSTPVERPSHCIP